MAKTATVTLPFALLVIVWWQRGTLSWRRDVLPLVPFFALSVATGLMTVWVETKLVGAEGAEFELTFAPALLARRPRHLVLPGQARLADEPVVHVHPLDDRPVPMVAMDASRSRRWPTTVVLWAIRQPLAGPLAAWLFFCGTLFPILGFVNVYMFRFTFVADHLQYLPSLGMIVLASAGIAIGLARASLRCAAGRRLAVHRSG